MEVLQKVCQNSPKVLNKQNSLETLSKEAAHAHTPRKTRRLSYIYDILSRPEDFIWPPSHDLREDVCPELVALDEFLLGLAQNFVWSLFLAALN